MVYRIFKTESFKVFAQQLKLFDVELGLIVFLLKNQK